jgi:TATA-box binding protein (TBP) (component of TFIID and TFIIIB)
MDNTAPTPYTVSTITCNARLGASNVRVNLQSLFDRIRLSDNGFVFVDYIGQNRGVYPKKRKVPVVDATANGKKKKSFDNQVTVIFKMPTYYPNVKIFGNAAVHMTGIRTAEDGKYVMDKLAEEMKELGMTVISPPDDVMAQDFVIRMINSGFKVPFKIRRKNLHQLLIGPKYNNVCSFQPLTYPGVKLEYYWNEQYQENKGVCMCTGNCFGKGNGHGEGDCKKVTLAIFESGQLLITGANAFKQIDAAYTYITNIVQDNLEEIRKVVPMPA